MNYGKNLTGERKATFSSVDITGQLSLDNGDPFGVGSEGVGERNVLCEATDFGEWNPTEPCVEVVPCRCGEPCIEDAALLR